MAQAPTKATQGYVAICNNPRLHPNVLSRRCSSIHGKAIEYLFSVNQINFMMDDMTLTFKHNMELGQAYEEQETH